MNRRELLRGSILYAFLPATLRASVADDVQQKDAAAIYSLLLSRAVRWLDSGERIGLNLATVAAKLPLLLSPDEKEPKYSGLPRPSITVPLKLAPLMARMAADLVALPSPVPLPSGITMPTRCLPMTPEDIRSFEELPMPGATYNATPARVKPAVPEAGSVRLHKVTGIVSYSGIAFNSDQSIALVAVTGHSGSSESYAVLGKAKSTWYELSWEMTSVVAAS